MVLGIPKGLRRTSEAEEDSVGLLRPQNTVRMRLECSSGCFQREHDGKVALEDVPPGGTPSSLMTGF